MSGHFVPHRRAPPPPVKDDMQRRLSLLRRDRLREDLPETGRSHFYDVSDGNSVPRAMSTPNIHQTGKKTPPPRPPPPKFSNKMSQKTTSSNSSAKHSVLSQDAGSLIDFTTPPSSPSPTRLHNLGSDGISLHSFSSDGTTSSHGNGHTGCHTESGFDDDFDPFGIYPKDAGSDVSHAGSRSSLLGPRVLPVGPVPVTQLKSVGSRKFRDGSSTSEQKSDIAQHANTSHVSQEPQRSMPTIIRPLSKPSVAPKKPEAKTRTVFPCDFAITRDTDSRASSALKWPEEIPRKSLSQSGDTSLPMPTVPPPEPPPLDLLNGSLPPLPPRPTAVQHDMTESPYAIALFDFPRTDPTDLSFKANTMINLIRRVNSEWMYGSCDGREGMFPEVFVQVLVPLPGETVAIVDSDLGLQRSASCPRELSKINESPEREQRNVVTALYEFVSQLDGDLTLQPGDKVTCLYQPNKDWLYGEVDGNQGLFPATYVDHVPSGLPDH